MADPDADIPLPDEGSGQAAGYASDDSQHLNDEGILPEHSDEEGEDLQEGAERDYRANPLLDEYEHSGLVDEVDANEGEDVTLEEALEARRRAEREMAKRDRAEGRRALPGALEADSEDEDMEERRPAQRRRVDMAQAGELDDGEGELDMPFGEVRGRTQDWVAQEPIQREVARRVRNFLDRFKDKAGDLVYKTRIHTMCTRNEQSLVVVFDDLSQAQPDIAMWYVDVPRVLQHTLNRVAKEATLAITPRYDEVQKDIFMRIENMPLIDKIRDISLPNISPQDCAEQEGVVTRRTGVFPQLDLVKKDCVKCGYTLGPFVQPPDREVRVQACPQCQSQGPFEDNTVETIYRNYQKMTVQEAPGTVPAGRLPRHKEVILTNDLIDRARPGEAVDVTAIYTNAYDAGLNVRNGFPVFATTMEAQWVSRSDDAFSAFKLTEEDRDEIQQLARDPKIGKTAHEHAGCAAYIKARSS